MGDRINIVIAVISFLGGYYYLLRSWRPFFSLAGSIFTVGGHIFMLALAVGVGIFAYLVVSLVGVFIQKDKDED